MSSETRSTSREAHQRFRTLQITASLSVDAAAISRIMAREAEARHVEGQRSVRIIAPTGGGGAGVSGDGWLRQTWRIWWTPPALWKNDLIHAAPSLLALMLD